MGQSQTGRLAGVVAPSFNFLMIVLIFAGTGLAIQTGLIAGHGAAFVFVFSGWVLSLCLHEFGHAFVAWKGGDHGIAQTGYLSLDPRQYVDPLNSIVLPLVFTILGGFGFPGGSVLVDRSAIRSRVWRSAVSAAGPAMNLLVLGFLALLYQMAHDDADTLRAVLAVSTLFQGTALILNLLPIPGLDGYGILQPWLPEGARAAGDRLALHSGLVLAGLFLLSSGFGRAIFRGGLVIASTVGFHRSDVVAGYQMIRLW